MCWTNTFGTSSIKFDVKKSHSQSWDELNGTCVIVDYSSVSFCIQLPSKSSWDIIRDDKYSNKCLRQNVIRKWLCIGVDMNVDNMNCFYKRCENDAN